METETTCPKQYGNIPKVITHIGADLKNVISIQ